MMVGKLTLPLLISSVSACSRVLFNAEDYPVSSVRTMDWPESLGDVFLASPAGMSFDGGADGAGYRSKQWTSLYGSTTIVGWGRFGPLYSNGTRSKLAIGIDGATEGSNEAGLTAHLLYLGSTGFPDDKTPTAKPAVAMLRFIRFILDTCANTREAVDAARSVQMVWPEYEETVGTHAGSQFKQGVHFAVEDAEGNSAILEFIFGELEVLQNGPRPKVSKPGEMMFDDISGNVMTNDPPIHQQLENLKKYKGFCQDSSCPQSCERTWNETSLRWEKDLCESMTPPSYVPGLAIPGGPQPDARFIRASYFLKWIELTDDPLQQLLSLRSVADVIKVTFSAPYLNTAGGGYIPYPTVWTIMQDFTNNVVYFQFTRSVQQLHWSLDKMAKDGWFLEGAPQRVLQNPMDPTLVGDVQDDFKRVGLLASTSTTTTTTTTATATASFLPSSTTSFKISTIAAVLAGITLKWL